MVLSKLFRWHKKFDSFMMNQGFKMAALVVSGEKLLYVNDMLRPTTKIDY